MKAFMINDMKVLAPDEEVWEAVSAGTSLDGTERRGGYYKLTWRKFDAGCDLAWFDYDNTVLDSIVTRSRTSLIEFERYTDVICQSVAMTHNRGRGRQVEATFLINPGA
jgi:hypothetical protein